MTKAKFPKRNEDGSFCVEVCVSVAGNISEDHASRIQGWIDDVWMPRNKTWKRVWRTGANLATIKEEMLSYDDEFLRPPKIVSCENSELRFRLFGKYSANFWRDWLVLRIMPDLKADFPNLEIGEPRYVKNCKE